MEHLRRAGRSKSPPASGSSSRPKPRGIGGLRLLPGRFMVIQQAMGTPASRGAPAASALAAFVEEAKSSGAVHAALQRHGVTGAAVAPAATAPAG